MKDDKNERNKSKTNILVYGIDRVCDEWPSKSLEGQSSILTFKDFRTEEKFHDYDGVITFQSIFESVKVRTMLPPGKYIVFDRDELVRRKKQLQQLIDKNGFVCFLLIRSFVDHDMDGSTTDTDLAKYALNHQGLHRQSWDSECSQLEIKRDEFRKFLKSYGVAKTRFTCYNKSLELRPICYCARDITGFIILGKLFFLPTYEPLGSECEEFFSLLADSLIPCFKKLSQELPHWVDDYRFKEEEELLAERDKLEDTIRNINTKVSTFRNFKKSLCYDDELLKESLISIMEDGFDFSIDPEDELKEDFKIIDDKEKPLVLVEVKGTNRGVQRDFINQADSYRERNNLPPDFPSILIVNTNIKKASSIEDKYQDVAEEQIKHAVKMKVLVLRSIDLLNLLFQKEAGKISESQLLNIFKEQCGWLKATRGKFEIVKEVK